jgi:gluconolactonase
MIGTLMSLRRLKISVPSWQVRCAIPNLESGAVSVVYRECGGRSLTGPNHIVFDQDGGFWFTDHGKLRPRDRDRGGIYYATIDGKSIREIVFPLDAPNGIALSPDGTRLYVAESFTARVWAWDVMGPGELRTKPSARVAGGDLMVGLGGCHLEGLVQLLASDAGSYITGSNLVVDGGMSVMLRPNGAVD